METAYIFLYSELENEFDYKLVKACLHYNCLELRARYNSHRNIKLYSILVDEQNANLINKLIEKDKDIAWTILKDKSLEINNG
jgi:hypothetical protein